MALFFGTLALLSSIFLIKPSYTASTRIYVLNKTQQADNLSATDLQAGGLLVNDYKEIITSRDVMKDVIANDGVSMTPEELSDYSISFPELVTYKQKVQHQETPVIKQNMEADPFDLNDINLDNLD